MPVYEIPEIEDQSASEEGDTDDEGEAALKLELGRGEAVDGDDESIDEESIDDISGNGDSPTGKKKKKKKRPKRKKKKAPGGDEAELMESAEGSNLPPKPPPSSAEVALAAAVARASTENPLLPKSPPKAGALAKRSPKRSPTALRVPTIARHERAPLPSGLVLPTGLVTRSEFMELSGCAGLTQKQLNKLQCLLEPSDPSLAGNKGSRAGFEERAA